MFNNNQIEGVPYTEAVTGNDKLYAIPSSFEGKLDMCMLRNDGVYT
jgi:hypothetical protein